MYLCVTLQLTVSVLCFLIDVHLNFFFQILAAYGHALVVQQLLHTWDAFRSQNPSLSNLIKVLIYLYLALYSSTASLADVRDSLMRTPLMLASEGGHAHCTDVLLSCTSSVDLCDINMRSALHRGIAYWRLFLSFSSLLNRSFFFSIGKRIWRLRLFLVGR